MALHWGSVDLESMVLTVRASVRNGREGPPKFGKPRKVPIAPKARRRAGEVEGGLRPAHD
jgi:hypothetical protein